MICLEFLACAVLITWSGLLLSKRGAVIAEKPVLRRALIGAILIAGVKWLLKLDRASQRWHE